MPKYSLFLTNTGKQIILNTFFRDKNISLLFFRCQKHAYMHGNQDLFYFHKYILDQKFRQNLMMLGVVASLELRLV